MIGRLRHRLTIQSATAAKSAFGEDSETWATLDIVWGRIEPLTGREFLAAEEIAAKTTHRITIRHRSDVTKKMRIVHGGRTFEIVSRVNPDERDRWLVLLCEERD